MIADGRPIEQTGTGGNISKDSLAAMRTQQAGAGPLRSEVRQWSIAPGSPSGSPLALCWRWLGLFEIVGACPGAVGDHGCTGADGTSIELVDGQWQGELDLSLIGKTQWSHPSRGVEQLTSTVVVSPENFGEIRWIEAFVSALE